jgi:TRAP-type C4-dicarboxylate transport system permease small subunit
MVLEKIANSCRRILNTIYVICINIAWVTLFLLLIFYVVQIGVREIFSIGWVWFLEIVKIALQIIIFVGIGSILSKPVLMRFELITSHLKGHTLKVCEAIITLFCLAFFVWLCV